MLGWLCLVLLAADGRGEPALKIKSLDIKPTGIFTFHGDTFSVALMDPDFHAVSQKNLKAESSYPKEEAETWTVKGEAGDAGSVGAFALSETIQMTGGSSVRAEFHVRKPDQKPFKVINLQVDMPVNVSATRSILIDDVPLVLPKDPARDTLLYKAGVKKIVVPARDGSLVLEGEFTAEVQDERRWGGDSFQLRLVIADAHRTGDGGDLELTIRPKPFRGTPIPLAAVANRDFHDDVADDRKGGWTDQGPDNDLSSLPPGPLQASAVPFQVIDPAGNGGKSCVVLSKAKDELPKSVDIPFAGHSSSANLYLLHAAAWLPKNTENVGVVHVHYTDGTSHDFDVRSQRDVGDWWSGASLPNAVVGWTGQNKSSEVALFVSRFQLESGKELAAVQLESASTAIWMVVALTASPDDIPLASDLPLVIRAGPDWADYPLKYHIEPGSVFDFSSLNDAPAGKYGPLVVSPDGHLEFAGRKGTNARFWGVNLTFKANFLDKENADQLADQLARSGYNTVRFHHYDGVLTHEGTSKSYELDPVPFDQLDYMFAAMKKRGLYVNIDLYTIRKFTRDELPDFNRDVSNIKIYLPISEPALESWKKFARNFLMHRNPYTGLTWGEDPALIGICPVNEDPLYLEMHNAPEDVQKIYRDKFARWADANHVPIQDAAAKNHAYNQFLAETQIAADQRMAEFIRSLKVNTLLTGVNCGTSQAQTYPREHYDYVDNHTYLDHPTFLGKSWQPPTLFRQSDPLQSRGGVMHGLMADRIFGKPYAVTEIHFCWPNRYRATEGVLCAGYASLQDWDAIYNFDYAGSATDVTGPHGPNFFHLVTDPIEMLADRAAAVVFRRGDIHRATGAVAFAVNEATAFAGGWGSPREFPQEFAWLGLVTRIGSSTDGADKILGSATAHRAGVTTVVGDGLTPSPNHYPVESKLGITLARAGVIPPAAVDAGGNRFTSDTGQIELSSKPGKMKVVTDRCELFSLPPGERSEGSFVSVENGQSSASTYVVSADGKPLAESDRLLVLFLTDSLNQNMTFQNSQATILESYGSMQTLVKRGTARITLQSPDVNARPWQGWAVDVNGTRGKPVSLAREGKACVLSADTIADGVGCLAWELSRSR